MSASIMMLESIARMYIKYKDATLFYIFLSELDCWKACRYGEKSLYIVIVGIKQIKIYSSPRF